MTPAGKNGNILFSILAVAAIFLSTAFVWRIMSRYNKGAGGQMAPSSEAVETAPKPAYAIPPNSNFVENPIPTAEEVEHSRNEYNARQEKIRKTMDEEKSRIEEIIANCRTASNRKDKPAVITGATKNLKDKPGAYMLQ